VEERLNRKKGIISDLVAEFGLIIGMNSGDR
jgi:hypothetical protein